MQCLKSISANPAQMSQTVTKLLKEAMSKDHISNQYTSRWIAIVDRGGLFKISDRSYVFFRAMENATRGLLPGKLKETTFTNVVPLVVSSCEVQKNWEVLSSSIEDESENQDLLKEVVSLWVTMRGFAITSAWLEQYKRTREASVQKKRSLRKRLAQHVREEKQ